MKVRLHTGCNCRMCRSGRKRWYRREFQRKLRRVHKRELKKDGDITNANLSIGYTD